MNCQYRCLRHARATARRRRASRYDGETAACGSCGTVYFKRDGHAC